MAASADAACLYLMNPNPLLPPRVHYVVLQTKNNTGRKARHTKKTGTSLKIHHQFATFDFAVRSKQRLQRELVDAWRYVVDDQIAIVFALFGGRRRARRLCHLQHAVLDGRHVGRREARCRCCCCSCRCIVRCCHHTSDVRRRCRYWRCLLRRCGRSVGRCRCCLLRGVFGHFGVSIVEIHTRKISCDS
jgi:hypothetical protein